jgi:hypothetical protein
MAGHYAMFITLDPIKCRYQLELYNPCEGKQCIGEYFLFESEDGVKFSLTFSEDNQTMGVIIIEVSRYSPLITHFVLDHQCCFR